MNDTGEFLTCHDLAEAGRWDTALCCAECHPHGLTKRGDFEHFVSAPNPLDGKCHGLVCCVCIELLDDWYRDRQYSRLPTHEELEVVE